MTLGGRQAAMKKSFMLSVANAVVLTFLVSSCVDHSGNVDERDAGPEAGSSCDSVGCVTTQLCLRDSCQPTPRCASGTACENKLDSCTPDLCHNGGTCSSVS